MGCVYSCSRNRWFLIKDVRWEGARGKSCRLFLLLQFPLGGKQCKDHRKPMAHWLWKTSQHFWQPSASFSPFRAEQGTSLETPWWARASSCQEVRTTWFFSSWPQVRPGLPHTEHSDEEQGQQTLRAKQTGSARPNPAAVGAERRPCKIITTLQGCQTLAQHGSPRGL